MEDINPRAPILQAKDLRENEILSIFKLTQDKNPEIWKPSNAEIFPEDVGLENRLSVLDFVVTLPVAHSRLDIIMSHCLTAEKHRMEEIYDAIERVLSQRQRKSKTCSIMNRPGNRVMMRFQTDVQYRVLYGYFIDKPRTLVASSGYSLWTYRAEGLGPSFVVAVEEGLERKGDVECLAYMATVHKIRKEAERNANVHGLFTDGFTFTFVRIDEESRVSKSHGLQWNWGDKPEILALLGRIIRTCIETVPEYGLQIVWAVSPDVRFTGKMLDVGAKPAGRMTKDSKLE